MDSTVEKTSSDAQSNKPVSSSFGFGDILFLLFLLFTFLWNWDGFWQTDIKPLNSIQDKFFSAKHESERLKLNNFTINNNILADYKERIRKSELDRDSAELKFRELNSDNVDKCRYLDSSLRMIDILTQDLSSEAIEKKLRCTSVECANILAKRQYVDSLCRKS